LRTRIISMAQYSPKVRLFDESWRPRFSLAVKLLGDFQNNWLKSDQPYPSSEVVAVLLNLFAVDLYRANFIGYDSVSANELCKRSLDEWLCSVESPKDECRRLCPWRQDAEYDEMVEILFAGLKQAADGWERDAADASTCEEVVQWMIEELCARRFLVIRH
jgi:hypothetical protein